MKVTTSQEKSEFKPVTISITLETEEEFDDFKSQIKSMGTGCWNTPGNWFCTCQKLVRNLSW